MTTATQANFTVGSGAFSAAHGASVRILDVETVWRHTVYQVGILRLATVERVPGESLPLDHLTKATGFGSTSTMHHLRENESRAR
jgi:hypothetical protein